MKIESILLTKKDLANIEVALRLRKESAEENNELGSAREWTRTWKKMSYLRHNADRIVLRVNKS